MRFAHVTDIHVEVPPTLGELGNKRLLGAVNLYILGRSHHFSVETQRGLVQAVCDVAPDVVLCTGDLTASGTEAEFAAARELLAPITGRFPFFVIPGNHDVYTGESVGRFERHFAEWAGPSRRFGDLDVVALDVCRPDWLSRGRAGERLAAFEAALAGTGPAWVMVHYPLRGRDGAPYRPFTRAIADAADIEAALARHPRVTTVLHGHEHHGFRTTIPREGPPLVQLDPGASGYAWLPKRRRTAHFNVYDLEGESLTVTRYAWDGARFAPEAGGAYATGG